MNGDDIVTGPIDIVVDATDETAARGGVKHVDAFDLLDSEELAEMLGITAPTLRVFRSRGNNTRVNEMPSPLRTISGRPVWSRHEVETWLAGRAS